MIFQRPAIGIIPARAQSTRFPHKVIAPILGRPMLQYIWAAASQAQSLSEVVIATDSEEVRRVAEGFGAKVVMTDTSFQSGSDRVAFIAKDLAAEIVVNLQADEPTLRPEAIDGLVEALRNDRDAAIATLIVKRRDAATFLDPNVVKAAVSLSGRAMYFSRCPLPLGTESEFWKHIGIYAYRREALLRVASLPVSQLEKAERLEQLRALENGMVIQTVAVTEDTQSVDVPDDVEKVEKYFSLRPHLLEYVQRKTSS